MKKYISILAIFAVAAIACNKVEPQAVEETPEVVSGTNTVSFRANLPAFGVESKATISNAGDFAWEEGDHIYVLAHSNNDSYWHVAFAYDTATGQFTCNFPATNYYVGTGNVTLDRVATADEAANKSEAFALYPDPQGLYTQVDYGEIQKKFNMEGSLNATGEIVFEHKSAMVNVHIANVPSIASYFTVAGGAETVKVDNLNGIAAINKAVPVTPTGSDSDIVIALYDSSDNVIVSKKKSNKTLVAGTLYDTPVITLPTYTVAGCSWDGNTPVASIFKTAWAPTETANDMTLGTDGIYHISYSSDTRHIQFKVVENHSWDNSWGGSTSNGNFLFNIRTAGEVNITFNPITHAVAAWDKTVYTIAGSPAQIFTTEWDPGQTANDMTMLDDGTFSITYNSVPASTWMPFKVIANHAWGTEWPSGQNNNYEYTSPDYLSNITITFNPYGNVDSANEGVGLITGVTATKVE